jgi:putative addiction module killer protein
MEVRERNVLYYKTSLEAVPFWAWRNRITDDSTRAIIDARIARLRGGNFGDSEPIGDGASENKIDFGPGFRIYYGIDGDKIVLLGGGDKSAQVSDIKQARSYWLDYKKREKARKATDKKALKNAELQRRSSKRSKN